MDSETIYHFTLQGRESLESNLSRFVKKTGSDFTVVKSEDKEIMIWWTEEGNFNGWNN